MTRRKKPKTGPQKARLDRERTVREAERKAKTGHLKNFLDDSPNDPRIDV